MNEIAKKRAERLGDCREWTPLDALEDLVSEIKAGKVNPSKIAIHWFEDEEDGRYHHSNAVAGVTFAEHIALLNFSLIATMEEWRGE